MQPTQRWGSSAPAQRPTSAASGTRVTVKPPPTSPRLTTPGIPGMPGLAQFEDWLDAEERAIAAAGQRQRAAAKAEGEAQRRRAPDANVEPASALGRAAQLVAAASTSRPPMTASPRIASRPRSRRLLQVKSPVAPPPERLAL